MSCLLVVGLPALSVQAACSDSVSPRSHLAFLSNRPGGNQDGNWDLYNATLDGDQVIRLTAIAGASIRWFDKHPTRNQYVVAGSTTGDLSKGPSGKGRGPGKAAEEIIALIAPEQELEVLLDLRPGGHNPEKFDALWHPSFSPNGKIIAFSAQKKGESFNLWLMRSDGSALRRVINDRHRTHNDPRFTPDGKIVYVRHEHQGFMQFLKPDLFDVWIVDPGKPDDNVRMTNEDSIAGPALIETDPVVSPDCSKVAMIRAHAPLTFGSILAPWSSNAIIAADGSATQFAVLQSGANPHRTHGVPSWIDNQELLSYRWSSTRKAWEIIRFSVDTADGDVQVIDLAAPLNYSDLMPHAF